MNLTPYPRYAHTYEWKDGTERITVKRDFSDEDTRTINHLKTQGWTYIGYDFSGGYLVLKRERN